MNFESIAKIVAELKAYGNQTRSVSSDIELSICIPARNEAQTIWKTLKALANQLSGDKAVPTQLYEVLVLCNNCNDDTVELCKLFQELNPIVWTGVAPGSLTSMVIIEINTTLIILRPAIKLPEIHI